jgi:hypothetical protein
MKELGDYFVSQEQAESLKELGFKYSCLACYTENGELAFRPSFHHTETSAPLIAQAIDWLANELGHTVTNVNNGIEGAIARKNIINRITSIYSTIYTDDLNVKMMLPLRDCFIHLQMNEFLFTAMLESYNYKKFEIDVLSTYVLTKKILLQLFNRHFNVLELKLLAQDKINNIKNQNFKFLKEIDSIKKDLLSFGSPSGTQNIVGTIKLNFPSVYNELVKATLKDGDNAFNFDYIYIFW